MTRDTNEGSLVRALGVWGLAAAIVNVTVGGGIFRLPAAAAAALGPAAPAAYVACAIAMGLIVLCFAEAGSRVARTGGLYAYVEVAFGPFVGFLVGIMLFAGITAAAAAVTSFLGDALGGLAPGLASPGGRAAALAVILAGFATLNVLGVRGANRFNAATTVAKLLPLGILIVVGIAAVRSENLAWTAPPRASAVGRASLVLVFAFLGIETALVPSGEVVNPARTVPRAIAIAMIGITLLYLAVQIVAQGILGPRLADQKTPLVEAARVAMGSAGGTLVLVGSVISMFGYVGAMTLAAPRMLFALARDGFLPRSLAAVHPRFRTPSVAILLETLVILVLALTKTFEKLGIIANGTVLIAYVACCAAVLELRRRGIQTAERPFQIPFASVVPVLAIAAIVWMLSSLTVDEWKAMAVVLGVAVVLYVASVPGRRAAVSETPA